MFHRWSEAEKEYLKEVVTGRSYREILTLMNDKFEYKFSMNQIKTAICRYNLNTGRNGQFEQGSTPWNKGKKGVQVPNRTSFKKGNIPKNYKPVGSTMVNCYGYEEVKVADPNKWKLKHHLVWEEHNGPVPLGCAVIFADRDRSNIDIDNLILVNKKQLLVLNKNNLIKEDADLTKVGVNVADLIIKITEVSK